ncbi:MAG: alpha amylase catalytic region [Streptosporangiaceae bacterium]|nr:alpha amylase catalytic region [Streptosporangiaceae bacterium]
MVCAPRPRRRRTAGPSRLRRIALAGVLAASPPVAAIPALASPAAAAGTPPGAKRVIVQLFEWKWDDVARECSQVLGPKGYGAVQVSPPQEHIVLPSGGQGGYPWWQDYQPVSYKIQTRRGTEHSFRTMVNACHAQGVKVYADAVINHMSASGGTGSAGTTFPDKYTYPGLYSGWDFHDCRRGIGNYQDRWEVQNCELAGLADLKTESDYVRGKIADYLNALLDLGVDGLRIDAAKHMPSGDIAAMEQRLKRSVYVYQEVIFGAGEPITPEEYQSNGDVHEFRAGEKISEKFLGESPGGVRQKIADLQTFGQSWGLLPSGGAVSFIDNHDTQRDALVGARKILYYRDGATYRLANVFLLGWNYGTPVVMSSFAFTQRDTSPPADGGGSTKTVSCNGTEWVCEHRWRQMANMVGFRNAAGDAAVGNWWSNGDNQIAFGRGSAGYVVINREGGGLSRTFQTGLPAGTYCDVIHGDFNAQARTCGGPTVTVNGAGQFTASVAGMDSLAVHTGARVS